MGNDWGYDKPTPNHIDCINVKKVYDSCFQIEEGSKDITILVDEDFLGNINPGDAIPCSLNGSITCKIAKSMSVPGNLVIEVTFGDYTTIVGRYSFAYYDPNPI